MKNELTKDDVVVVLFHDHGSRYVGKMFNDDWMRERGFLEENVRTASDLIAKHEERPLISVFAEELVSHAIAKMRKFGISQIPVMKDNQFVGSIDDAHVYQLLVDSPELKDVAISKVMGEAFPIVKHTATLEQISKLINKNTPAALVEKENGKYHIITRYDIYCIIVINEN